MNASMSSDCHCHGYSLTNATTRRTNLSRELIVSAFRNRVRCCSAHPLEHGLEHRRLWVEMTYSRHEYKMRRTC